MRCQPRCDVTYVWSSSSSGYSNIIIDDSHKLVAIFRDSETCFPFFPLKFNVSGQATNMHSTRWSLMLSASMYWMITVKGHSERGQTSQQRTSQKYSCIHTLYRKSPLKEDNLSTKDKMDETLFGHVCTLNEEKISSCSMSATAPSQYYLWNKCWAAQSKYLPQIASQSTKIPGAWPQTPLENN